MEKKFEVVRLKDADIAFEGDTGTKLDKKIDETKTDEMGAGYFSIHKTQSRMNLPYDEVAFCVKGLFKLTVDGVTHELQPGDFAFIPKGTDVTFDGENAVCAYGVHPVDWSTRG